MKIEAINQELCKLKDGQSFSACMTIKDARLAISSLDVNDRKFELHQDGQQIRVTCHYTEKTKCEIKAIGFLLSAILGAFILFAIAQTAFYEMDSHGIKTTIISHSK